jgi:hypothetical protein
MRIAVALLIASILQPGAVAAGDGDAASADDETLGEAEGEETEAAPPAASKAESTAPAGTTTETPATAASATSGATAPTPTADASTTPPGATTTVAEPPTTPAPAVDGLGRPFPDPLVLRKANAWMRGGIVLSGAGSAMLVSGLFFGSALARGEIGATNPKVAGAAIGAVFVSGAAMLAAGIPLTSSGSFTRAQMLRTIKGAAKVPRTVANEQRYWNMFQRRHFGQALAVGGGGAILMGVVSVAGVVALIGTEYYRPWQWAAVGGTFGVGAAMVALGVTLTRTSREQMETIWREVDPYTSPDVSARRARPRVLAASPFSVLVVF